MMKMPRKVEKKYVRGMLLSLGLVLVCVSLGINVYFGWLRVKAIAYQQGFSEGQNVLNQTVLAQLKEGGKLTVNVPQEDGTIKSMILIPQVDNPLPEEEIK
jgi:hypothetical protein